MSTTPDVEVGLQTTNAGEGSPTSTCACCGPRAAPSLPALVAAARLAEEEDQAQRRAGAAAPSAGEARAAYQLLYAEALRSGWTQGGLAAQIPPRLYTAQHPRRYQAT